MVINLLRTFGLTKNSEPCLDFDITTVKVLELQWYWIDIYNPSEADISLLSSHFKFHPLAIEDSVFSLNRPKIDYYEGYNFFILNAIKKDLLEPSEVSLYIGEDYIVSFHMESLLELDEAWERITKNQCYWEKGPTYIFHQIMDNIVDHFFPSLYQIEDRLDSLDQNIDNKALHRLMEEVFQIRGNLLKLRRVVFSMRDLVYRLLNSERLTGVKEHKLYFSDIYDHLLKLSEMIESSQEMTADMRDSYLSLNSNRMNTNMMVLTVITTIFIPLTFVAGIYGMNFENMPELTWKYGYFLVLGIMALIGTSMFLWFKRKGWFYK
jgi:magnesium transporter